MRHYLAFLAALILSPPAALASSHIPIMVTVTCVENPTCAYIGSNIHLQISVRNAHTFPVRLPLKFITRTGPFIRLTDNKNNNHVSIGRGIPDYELQKNLTTLQPGESFEFPWVIFKSEIDQLDSKPVDILARVTLINNEQKKNIPGITKYAGESVIRIMEQQ